MKFYKSGPAKVRKKYNYYKKIINNKLTAIYINYYVLFYKNGVLHNIKNAAYKDPLNKYFYLNGVMFGSKHEFAKKSWRRFVQLEAFL